MEEFESGKQMLDRIQKRDNKMIAEMVIDRRARERHHIRGCFDSAGNAIDIM